MKAYYSLSEIHERLHVFGSMHEIRVLMKHKWYLHQILHSLSSHFVDHLSPTLGAIFTTAFVRRWGATEERVKCLVGSCESSMQICYFTQSRSSSHCRCFFFNLGLPWNVVKVLSKQMEICLKCEIKRSKKVQNKYSTKEFLVNIHIYV